MLRSVSRSGSPSDKEGGVCLKSRSPTPEYSLGDDLAKAVRGEAAPSRPAAPAPPSPTSEISSGDDLAKAVRGEAAPSRPAVPAPPDFAHLEVDRQSGSELVESSDEVPGKADGGEVSPSKGKADEQEGFSGHPLPASLQRLLQSCQPVGDSYTPYTAVLGFQRRKPMLIWHHFVAVRQELPRIPESHLAMQQRGQVFERKVYQLIGYGTNRAAFAREDGNEVLKIGMVGCHGLERPCIATCSSNL